MDFTQDYSVAYLEAPDGERIYLNGVPWAITKNIVAGFEGDDRIPIFCACMMSEEILEKTGENSFKIKNEYIQELSQFGSHVAMIPLGELLEKLECYVKENPQVGFKSGVVRYVDIKKQYDPNKYNDKEEWYLPFFTKDNAYKFQNEWRLIAVGAEDLIASGENCWVCEVGAFQYAVKMSADDLIHGEFHISTEDSVEMEE